MNGNMKCINERNGSGIFPSLSVPGNFPRGKHTQAMVFQEGTGILFAQSHTTLTLSYQHSAITTCLLQ